VGTATSTNYSLNLVGGSLTVMWAPLTVSVNNTQRIYGQPNPTFTFSVQGLVNGDTQATALTGMPSITTAATASSPVGPYRVFIAQGTLAAANYTITFANGALIVNPATLTVTAVNTSKLYGAQLPNFTVNYTGFVNGDTAVTAVIGEPYISTNATAASPVGNYTITPSDGGRIQAENYVFTFVNGTLTITGAPLTVTVNNASKLYGAPLPAFSYSVAGLVNGDTSAVVTGSPIYSTTATAASGVGMYPVNAMPGTLAAHNYTITLSSGTLTVTPTLLKFVATNASRTYGQTASTQLAYTVVGLVNGDTDAMAFTGTPLVMCGVTPTTPVGNYTILMGDGTAHSTNYILTTVNATMTITPAVLQLTANPVTRLYGQANPLFTYKITGFVNGQNQSIVTGTPLFTDPEVATTPVGEYPIVAGNFTLKAPNYTFAPAIGNTFTINPAPLAVHVGNDSGNYGSAPNVSNVTYTVTGFVNGQTKSVLSGVAEFTTTATASSPVATYPISYKVGSLTAKNYVLTGVNGTFTVNKVKLTFTAGNLSMVKGHAVPSLTTDYTVAGYVNHDTKSTAFTGAPKLTTTATSNSPVNSYPIDITQGTLASKNYTLAFVNGTMKVTN
jgi:hypothetical protein